MYVLGFSILTAGATQTRLVVHGRGKQRGLEDQLPALWFLRACPVVRAGLEMDLAGRGQRLEPKGLLELNRAFDYFLPPPADALRKQHVARRQLEKHSFEELCGTADLSKWIFLGVRGDGRVRGIRLMAHGGRHG